MFKRMKLATKLAVTIGIVLTVIFTLLITVTVTMSQSAISESISGELDAISKSNGNQVQQIFDAANTAAVNMQSYLNKAYQIAEDDPKQMEISTDVAIASMLQSVIYKTTLASLNYDVEQFIMETARNTAVNNPDIVGMGVMFEPKAFQENIRDYAFHASEGDANKTIVPFGAYETYSAQAYYKDAASAKKAVVTDPYEYEGVTMVTYSVPILSNGTVQGVIMADINVTNFSKVSSTSERYKSMYATIYDGDGKIIYDSEDISNVGKNLSDFTPNSKELSEMKNSMAQGQTFQVETTRESGVKVTRFFNPVIAGSETWWSLTALETSDMNESVNKTILMLVLLSTGALVAIILITVTLMKTILRPLQNVVQAAESIVGGDLQVQIVAKSQDEIGVLSQSFQKMADSLKAIIADVGYLLGEMGDGNFQIESNEEKRYIGDYSGLLVAMRRINRSLSSTLLQINQSSDQVSSGSEQVSGSAQALSQGATEQASSVEELAATITEISAQVKETAQNAVQARAQTNIAGDEVAVCNEKMREMIEAMADISNKSREISKIIKSIEDIAFQTNILALNAAVEAARAGVAGKGFAVVADEVRNLASKSAQASKNTSGLIEGSIHAVEKGTIIASETAQALLKVVEGTQSVSVTVDKIAKAANEQATSIAQVTMGVDQISSVVQTNSATAEESAAASEELSGQAQMLKQLVSNFKLQTDDAPPSSEPPMQGAPKFAKMTDFHGKY